MMELRTGEEAVFVYGTLMRGCRANYMLKDARFCGRYHLKDYAMYDLGRYPGICPQQGGLVQGEVYLVSPDMLSDMDEYEEEGSLYHRRRVEVWSGENSCSVWVYVYAGAVSGLPMDTIWKDK